MFTVTSNIVFLFLFFPLSFLHKTTNCGQNIHLQFYDIFSLYIVTSNRRDSVEAEGPEAKAASANAQLQRLRETTKLLADGHPQLRADPTLSPSRLMQTNESSNHNRSSTNNTSHKNQNGDVTTPTTVMMTPVKLLASPEQKGWLSFVMASGVEDDDVTAAHPTPTIPVVHHKPVG